MYIARPLHEKELKRAIQGSKHAIVSGVSGTGKSWLCKKVAKDEKWTTKFANCANASRLGSLTEEIINALIPDGSQNQVGYSQTLAGEVGIPGLKGGATTNRTYTLAASDELEKAFRTARALAGKNSLIVILDNLESIFSNKELMQELGNILLLLDDSRYAIYRVKFLLVGIPSEIREYFHCLPNLEPVSNRLTEVAPLRSLSASQVKNFVNKGFNGQLLVGLPPPTLDKWAHHIFTVTLGLAERVHEYCEYLAFSLEDDGWNIADKRLTEADSKFLFGSLHKSYAVIESCMNERQTKTSRRNQVLYTLGTIGSPEFDAKVVENRLRELFPNSTDGVTLGIGRILSELCEDDRPMLKRVSKTSSFCFADPKLIMCLRLVLGRRDDELIIKKQFRR